MVMIRSILLIYAEPDPSYGFDIAAFLDVVAQLFAKISMWTSKERISPPLLVIPRGFVQPVSGDDISPMSGQHPEDAGIPWASNPPPAVLLHHVFIG